MYSGCATCSKILFRSTQVCSVLESLEREYRREEDWCSSESVAASSDKAAAMEQLILKHQEKKEAFLKVSCRGYDEGCYQ